MSSHAHLEEQPLPTDKISTIQFLALWRGRASAFGVAAVCAPAVARALALAPGAEWLVVAAPESAFDRLQKILLCSPGNGLLAFAVPPLIFWLSSRLDTADRLTPSRRLLAGSWRSRCPDRQIRQGQMSACVRLHDKGDIRRLGCFVGLFRSCSNRRCGARQAVGQMPHTVGNYGLAAVFAPRDPSSRMDTTTSGQRRTATNRVDKRA